MAKILIVEDDKNLSDLIADELGFEGFEVARAFDGEEAVEKAVSGKPDLILLDVMLPKMDGYEVIRKIRRTCEIPVIFVSARDETFDMVNGLNFGADDYVTKPFKMEALIARINAVLRRTKKAESQKSVVYENGGIRMVADEMKVTFDGVSIELSKNEFLLLKFFLENKDKILSRNEIINRVWGEDIYIEENSVDVYVGHLRRLFGQESIKSVRGVGFVMRSI
jgi:two-component system response regulator ArlR